MATNPKMAPCPLCGGANYLRVFVYDSGWRYVECCARGCFYCGPGEGSARQAIKSHNERCAADKAVQSVSVT